MHRRSSDKSRNTHVYPSFSSVSKCIKHRATILPPLTVEPRGASVRSRPVSGAHAAEKLANRQLESATFVRAAMLERKEERDRSRGRILSHHRRAENFVVKSKRSNVIDEVRGMMKI